MAPPARQRLADKLVPLAILGGVVSAALSTLVLVAGTALTGHDGRGRPIGLLLKHLAVVSFDGVIYDDSSRFLVHLHYFCNAFAWEYPLAAEALPSAGIVSRGPFGGGDVYSGIRTVAKQLGIPRSEWDCPTSGDGGEPCANAFFNVRHDSSYRLPSMMAFAPWFMLLGALLLSISTMLQEWMIKRKPYWMKCRCWVLKRFCPCPKGTREEIEALGDQFWDRVRFCYWAVVFLYCGVSAAQGTFVASVLELDLRRYSRQLPEGMDMNVRRGWASSGALWASFGASFFSFVCIAVKLFVGQLTDEGSAGTGEPRRNTGEKALKD